LRQKFRIGFTLIELLVVCAIITVLAVIVFVSYSNSQKKSRDSRRITDVSTIMTAIVLQSSEQTDGTLLKSDGFISPKDLSPTSNEILAEVLIPKGYLNAIPCDPLGCCMDNYCGYSYYRGDFRFPTFCDDSLVKNYGTKKGFVYASLENETTNLVNKLDLTDVHGEKFDICIIPYSNIYESSRSCDSIRPGAKYNFKISN